MTTSVADMLERILQRSPGLTARQLYAGLGPEREKVGLGFVLAILRNYPERFAQAGGRWYLTTISPDDALAVDRDLRERLSGRRIVAEIGVDARLHDRSVQTLIRLMQRHLLEDVARLYPALLVTYLAGHGVFGYTAGDFYGTITVRGVDQRAGPLFAEAVRQLRLETFDDLVLGDNALRYVGPMLAHGGIPEYCLDDFFGLLLRDANKAEGDARELLAFWRTRKSAFFGIDAPVRRFLLYGGELARELLDRCLDLVREFERSGTVARSDDAGLPPYLVEAFRNRPGRPAPGPRAGPSRLARPMIRLDPWDPSGVVLVLPPVLDGASSAWRLQADGQLERLATSAIEVRQVRLRPAKAWSVSLDGAMESLDVSFEGLDNVRGLLFDCSTGRLLPAGAGVRADEVWLLVPEDTKVDGIGSSGARSALVDVQELPNPTGDWSGYVLRHLSLKALRSLSFHDRTGGERRVSVRPTAERPRLTGTSLAGVTTADGAAVYSSVPGVELPNTEGFPASAWTARVGVNGVWHLLKGNDDDSFPALPASPERCATVDLVVQGPLGSDLRTSFAVVPGLIVDRPERLLFPDDPVGSVRMVSDTVAINDSDPGVSVSIRVPDGSDVVRCRAGHLVLEVRVVTVLWGIARASVPDLRLSNGLLVLADDDVVDGEATALVVRCGRADIPLALSLTAQGRTLQSNEVGRSSGPDGKWSFDLGRFADAIRMSDAPASSFVLNVGHRPLTAARLRPSLDVTALAARSRITDEHTVVELAFEEERVLRNRVARLWSIERPWEPPVVAPIPDGQIGRAVLEGNRIRAGTYLAEIAIDDGWTQARRPLSTRQDVARIQVGSAQDVRERMARLPLDDVLAVLEIALTTGRLPRIVHAHELPKIIPAALAAMKVVLAGPGPVDLTARQLWAVAPVLRADPGCLAIAVSDAAELGVLDPSDLLLLTIALGSRLAPPPGGTLPELAIRGLWEVAPALAALLDLSRKPGDAAAARAREFLGWEPADGAQAIRTGDAITQLFVGMSEEQLRAIQRSAELVPGRLLDLDALVLANFEWLLAAKVQTADAAAWWRDARGLVDRLGGTGRRAVAAHMAARQPPPGTEPWAALPQATLAAAVHIVVDSTSVPEAQRALVDAVTFAPRLVTRDLVLARALTLDGSVLEACK